MRLHLLPPVVLLPDIRDSLLESRVYWWDVDFKTNWLLSSGGSGICGQVRWEKHISPASSAWHKKINLQWLGGQSAVKTCHLCVHVPFFLLVLANVTYRDKDKERKTTTPFYTVDSWRGRAVMHGEGEETERMNAFRFMTVLSQTNTVAHVFASFPDCVINTPVENT